jgi:predicted small secreted protein
MKLILRLLIASLLVVAAGGCNTIEGLGKDIQKGGEKIEKAADKAK